MRGSGTTKKLKTEEEDAPPHSNQEGPSKTQANQIPGQGSSRSTSPNNLEGPPEQIKQVGTDDEDEGKTVEDGTKSTSSSTEADAATGRTNPLENPVILNHLFKLCDSKLLLANCRLVSKQWYQESLLTWRTNFPVTFIQDKKDNDSTVRLVLGSYNQEHDGYTSLQEFLTYCADPKNQCSSKPYRYFKLEGCDFSSNPEQFQQLWGAFGSNLTTLHLHWCEFKDAEGFRETIYKACPNLQTLELERSDFSTLFRAKQNFTDEEPEPEDPDDSDSREEPKKPVYREPLYGRHPHLKSLHVQPHPESYHEGLPSLPISWLELFSHFQNLTHFSFAEDNPDFEDEFECLTDAIRTVRERDPKALPFKCVQIGPAPDISKRDPESQMKMGIVQELRLPLKSLLIKVKPEMDEATVKDVLELHAKTVKEIELIKTPFAELLQPFPFGIQLDHLTTLYIRENLCESMTFLKFTPNLEHLVISGDDSKQTRIISNSCKDEMANFGLPQLLTFRLDCIVADKDLARLFEWMPNVKSLKLTVNDNQFGIVCGNWKYLTSLSVEGGQLAVAVVTGTEDHGWEQKEQATHSKNITNLQNLEEFTFWSDQLGDASVFQGFLKLPRLQHLKCFTMNLLGAGKAREALEERKVRLHQQRFHVGRTV